MVSTRASWPRHAIFEYDRGAVGNDLDHLASDLGRVETQSDHRVRAVGVPSIQLAHDSQGLNHAERLFEEVHRHVEGRV